MYKYIKIFIIIHLIIGLKFSNFYLNLNFTNLNFRCFFQDFYFIPIYYNF